MAVRVWAAIVLAVAGAPEADPSAAGPVAWQLEWTAPESCRSADAMHVAVAARVPADLKPRMDTLHARGSIVQAPDGFVLRLELSTPKGTRQRTARGPDCNTLADAAALIVALAVRSQPARAAPLPPDATSPVTPEAPTAPDRPIPAAPHVPEPAIPTTTDSLPPRNIAPETESSMEVGVWAAAGPRIGLLPQIGLELELAPWLALGALRGALWLSWQQPRAARFPGTPTQGADIGAWSVGPTVCGVPQHGRWYFPLCAGALLGGLYARGVGLADNQRDHLFWGAAATAASVEYSVRPWLRLFVGARGRIAFTRPRFASNVRGQVHQASRASANLLVGANFVLTRQNGAGVSN